MTALNKQALRQLAEEATPGPWRYLKTTPFMDAEISAENHTRVVNLLAGDVTAYNSEFIAAANPATVLALLDENLQLQRNKDSLEAVAVAMRDDMRDAREKLEAAENRNNEIEAYSKTTLEFRDAALSENRHLKLELEIAASRIADLEARTVNLPAACADDEYFIDGVFQALRYERDVERAIRAAGIGVKGE
ncbi:TPA: ead/Ea22-like family protein [Escherichia coli]|uniref:ead/Ea22-like family protein n=1 Tax=Escherichia coli TaxID=562 RepID=UPI001E2C4D33|nr:ead/Ea22-like family protein [Escherichia coli]MCC5020608.1 ead/Ea22-like family protein [Escherichia coli]HCH7866319.1 ead/Ea22-like family protein [Escherichia coli]